MTEYEELAEVVADAFGAILGIFDTSYEEDMLFAAALIEAGWGKVKND